MLDVLVKLGVLEVLVTLGVLGVAEGPSIKEDMRVQRTEKKTLFLDDERLEWW